MTTAATGRLAGNGVAGSDLTSVHQAWNVVSAGGARPVVVRSSSVAEDGQSSSMAGRYTSVLDVHGWPAFLDAVATVVASAGDAPMGVLVQPFLQPRWGGVLFGADPVTGRRDRLVVSAVCGGPHRLVSGEVDGVQFTLSPRGRLGETSDPVPNDLRRRSVRRALAGLARTTAAVFGSAQDIEWALDGDGGLVLLQSRPITALGIETRAVGPLLGPGPVAETFPARLRPLEVDLWVSPLREGLRQALRIVGTTSARRLRRSPIVVVVDGWVAADLDLLGVSTRRRRLWTRLDPRPPARRLAAAWRVGRLKVALEALARDLIDDVDDDLRSLPELERLAPAELVHLLRRSHQTLVALHGHEVLAGMLLDEHHRHTAAAAALRVLADARGPGGVTDDVTDAELVAQNPVLLSLVPPQIGTALQLPHHLPRRRWHLPPAARRRCREALRLHVRWVHEVTARAALAVGAHLVGRGTITSAEAVSRLRLDELVALVESGGSLLVDLRDIDAAAAPAAPLPATFRLGDDGAVVPVVGVDDGEGRGAGAGAAVVRCTSGTTRRHRWETCSSCARSIPDWPAYFPASAVSSLRRAASCRTWRSSLASTASRRWSAWRGRWSASPQGSGSWSTGRPARCRPSTTLSGGRHERSARCCSLVRATRR